MSFRLGILLALVLLVALPYAVLAESPAEGEFSRVMQLKPDVRHGQELFDTCAACHGLTGSGVSDGTVPAIAGQHFSVIVRALIGYRHDRRQDPRMQHFANQHHLTGEQDVADLAAYISRLLPTLNVQHGDGLRVERGRELYAGRCASCHGVKGQGSEDLRYPRLAGQHYDYLLQRASGEQWLQSPKEHARFVETLGHSDLLAVCDYLSRLKP